MSIILEQMVEQETILPNEIIDEVPISEKAEQTITKARKDIRNILNRTDKRLIIITGPCSIDDSKAALEYAQKLKELSDEVDNKILLVMRTYFEKPRTTGGWEGLLIEPDFKDYNPRKGYIKARKLLLNIVELGIPTATELLELTTSDYIGDLISWAAIGARTTESQPHRKMVSDLDIPVGFKNTTSGNISAAVNAAKYSTKPRLREKGYTKVKTRGNPDTHIILRGGKQPNYDEKSVRQTLELLKQADLMPNIIIDCSHANSEKDYTKQTQVAMEILKQRTHNQNLIGLMLESYLKQGKGNQYGQSKTDSCISFEKTKELVKQAYSDN